jgi:hypothetical protein
MKTATRPAHAAAQFFRDRRGWTVSLRYDCVNGNHVIYSDDVDGDCGISYTVFATVEEARAAWREARAELLAAGFRLCDPI